jgi:hypothetical protein
VRKIVTFALLLVLATSGLTSAPAADSLVVSKVTPYKANIAGVGDIWKGDIPTSFEFPLGSYSQYIEFPIQGILPYAVLADRATGTNVEFELWSTVGKKIAYATVYSFSWNPIGPNTLVSLSLREAEAIGSHVLIIRTIYETNTNGLLTSYLKQEIQMPVTVTGMKKDQTITTTQLIDRNLSTGSFSLYSSDFKSSDYSLTVAVSSSTPLVCSVSGSTVKLLSEGTCTLVGQQPGNSSVGPAQQVTSSFQVTKKNQTLTAVKISDKYLSVGSFSLYSSDFRSSESSLSVEIESMTKSVCTVSGLQVKLISEGTCTLVGEQSGNLTISAAQPVSSSFQVTKKSQTLTSGKLSDKNLSIGSFSLYSWDFWSSESSLSVDVSSLTTSVCTTNGLQVKLISLGKCTLQASQNGTLGVAAANSVTSSFNVLGSKPIAIANMSGTKGQLEISYKFKKPLSDYPILKYEVSIQALTASNLPPSKDASYGPYTLLKNVDSEDFQVTIAEIKRYLETNRVADITNTSVMVRVRAISEGGDADWGGGVYSETKNFGWLTPAKKTSITCTKGKLIKKVTAVNPKCPAGYKKK